MNEQQIKMLREQGKTDEEIAVILGQGQAQADVAAATAYANPQPQPDPRIVGSTPAPQTGDQTPIPQQKHEVEGFTPMPNTPPTLQQSGKRSRNDFSWEVSPATDSEAFGEGLFTFGLKLLASSSRPGANFGEGLAEGLAAGTDRFMGALNRNKRYENIEKLQEKGFNDVSINDYLKSGDNKVLSKDPRAVMNVGNIAYAYDPTDPKGTLQQLTAAPVTKGTGWDMKVVGKQVVRMNKDTGDVEVWNGQNWGKGAIQSDGTGSGSGYPTDGIQLPGGNGTYGVGVHKIGDKYYEVKPGAKGLQGFASSKGDYDDFIGTVEEDKPRNLSVGEVTRRDAAYQSSIDGSMEADSAERQANQIQTLVTNGEWKSGVKGKAAEWVANQLGFQDDVSLAKKDFDALRNNQVIKAMPSGPASDNDVRIFSSGFPTNDWEPEKLQQWLRGRAKVLRYKADIDNFTGDYYSTNNSGLGRGVVIGEDGNKSAVKTYPEHLKDYINSKYGADDEKHKAAKPSDVEALKAQAIKEEREKKLYSQIHQYKDGRRIGLPKGKANVKENWVPLD